MVKKSEGKIDNEENAVAPLSLWQAALSGIWRKLLGVRPDLTTLAVIWSAAAFLELTLQLLVPRSSFHSSELPMGGRFFLFCYSLTILTIFLFLIRAAIKLAASAVAALIPVRIGSLSFADGCAALLVWLVLILYGASWGLFWQTGSFIDSQVFIFLAPHPLQVFHWVDLDIALFIIATTGAASLAIIYWVPRWTARQAQSFHNVFHGIWIRSIGLCIFGALLGHPYSTWGERPYTRSGIVYTRNQEHYSGLFSYIVTDLKKYIKNTDGGLRIGEG